MLLQYIQPITPKLRTKIWTEITDIVIFWKKLPKFLQGDEGNIFNCVYLFVRSQVGADVVARW